MKIMPKSLAQVAGLHVTRHTKEEVPLLVANFTTLFPVQSHLFTEGYTR